MDIIRLIEFGKGSSCDGNGQIQIALEFLIKALGSLHTSAYCDPHLVSSTFTEQCFKGYHESNTFIRIAKMMADCPGC